MATCLFSGVFKFDQADNAVAKGLCLQAFLILVILVSTISRQAAERQAETPMPSDGWNVREAGILGISQSFNECQKCHTTKKTAAMKVFLRRKNSKTRSGNHPIARDWLRLRGAAMESARHLVNAVCTAVPGEGPRAGTGAPDFLTDTNTEPQRFCRLTVELP